MVVICFQAATGECLTQPTNQNIASGHGDSPSGGAEYASLLVDLRDALRKRREAEETLEVKEVLILIRIEPDIRPFLVSGWPDIWPFGMSGYPAKSVSGLPLFILCLILLVTM